MSYHKAVSEGKCLVVIAENPDGKYISIEFNTQGCYGINQAYYRANRHIEQKDRFYLDNWADGITQYVRKLEEN